MAIAERYVSSLAGGGGDGLGEGTAWTFAEMLTNLVAGQRANVKDDGAYTLASAINHTFVATGATATAVFNVRGYTSTIGDGGRPTVTATAGWFDWGDNTSSDEIEGLKVQDLIVKGSNTSNPTLRIDRGSSAIRVDVENTSGTFADHVLNLQHGAVAIGCSIKYDSSVATARGVFTEGGGDSQVLIECAVKASKVGIEVKEGHILRCLVVSAGTTGVTGILLTNNGGDSKVMGCTVSDFACLIDVTKVADPDKHDVSLIMNCLLYSGTDAVVNSDTNKTKLLVIRNFIGGVTNSFVGLGDADPIDTVILAAGPFTNSAGDDFSLNDATGGGAEVKGQALQVPALIP